ncbi:pre-miRNA 5'-monophosphate methyltransferase [Lingula anatina]|uniref:RNA methyltransferase n=1 Tax=Lingula anatina TaxID=7574 RepID=A0A1S3J8U5_LINAN|nr:pre-miRNA 5'-monophosphate methyltransferase [Lingula anatina]|eukprot:XP_013406733.1 pre-miRNA 5'-monophosphate methyltransferase [Lingula anatina]
MNATTTKKFEPGAAVFGNFINYYSFNPPENRLKFIPTDFLFHMPSVKELNSVAALDVGCNAGDLTLRMYEHLTEGISNSQQNMLSDNLHILGVDIDECLIKRAKEANHYPKNIQFNVLDILDDTSRKYSLQTFLNKIGKERFDIVFCFSVTLWIHLNNGDEGLKKFLTILSGITENLVLEPQPWKCYKSAVRRVKKLNCPEFEHFKSLTWRDNVEDEIQRYLINDCKLHFVKSLGQTHWERNVLLYSKVHG